MDDSKQSNLENSKDKHKFDDEIKKSQRDQSPPSKNGDEKKMIIISYCNIPQEQNIVSNSKKRKKCTVN